ncbi:alpha/beta hydrolase [Methanoculleus sp. Wushi-C6]|uniref:Alpha/beta hydrolase n=1 Tax=Methanoculleus caldifontis TaxID=2651577 RepID=A0ABU3X1G6_9EURY|nr:alpha/beta hydrolase [Methanoculleus sp. Wushi-C6]MDV2481266.1 alpha/beta hydrolase [Methanoculleus sp. Wushi-C6]
MSRKPEGGASGGSPAGKGEPVPLGDELLLIRGERSFLLVGKAGSRFPLCIETPDDEYCLAVDPDDLVAVSMPEGGPVEQARMMLELVRRYHIPLVVLPKDHPGSKRLSMVVSVAPEIHLSCDIRRGTHPEQHLLCSSGELTGLSLAGIPGGVLLKHLPDGAMVRYLDAENSSADKQQ